MTSTIYVATLKMKLEFDAIKNTVNQNKHGFALALAGELDWETAMVWIDDDLTTKKRA